MKECVNENELWGLVLQHTAMLSFFFLFALPEAQTLISATGGRISSSYFLPLFLPALTKHPYPLPPPAPPP